jgi:hypothetical protein
MPSKSPIFIPQAVVWLLRLATNPSLAHSLLNNPVAFAAWYAAIGEIIEWPGEVVRIREDERAKRLSLGRMMKLLAQVNHVFSGRTSAEHARLVLEGYALHDWVNRNSNEFMALAAKMQQKLSPLNTSQLGVDEAVSPFAARIAELGQALNLSPLEQDILSFAFLTTVSDELGGLFEQLASDRWTAGMLWTALFDASAEELGRSCSLAGPPLRPSSSVCSAVPDFRGVSTAREEARFRRSGDRAALRSAAHPAISVVTRAVRCRDRSCAWVRRPLHKFSRSKGSRAHSWSQQ